MDIKTSDCPAQVIEVPANTHINVGNMRSTTRLNKKDWERILEDFEKSGLSQKIFCAQHDIKACTFSYHRSRQLKRQQGDKKFIPIQVKERARKSPICDSGFILSLRNGSKLMIPQQYDKSALKNLLTMLGVCQ